jgi:hypothetical protein
MHYNDKERMVRDLSREVSHTSAIDPPTSNSPRRSRTTRW